MCLPQFDASPDVVVIQFHECLEHGMLVAEIVKRVVMLQQHLQAVGARKLFPGLHDVLRAPYNVHEQTLCTYRSLVKINLPVHKPASIEKVFDTINPFFVDHHLVLPDVEHRHDPVYSDRPFGNAGEKTVSFKIIKPVDVELAGDQLMVIPTGRGVGVMVGVGVGLIE